MKAKPKTKRDMLPGEIYFTMKVYATHEFGTLKTLKYTIDLNPPFEANTQTIKRTASPIVKENMGMFDKIMDNVKEMFRFISNPVSYNPKAPESKGWRLEQQKNLLEAIRLSNGAINYITYEQNSPPDVTVGAVFNTTGNGDMRPPDTV